jgi:hypothetical protein
VPALFKVPALVKWIPILLAASLIASLGRRPVLFQIIDCPNIFLRKLNTPFLGLACLWLNTQLWGSAWLWGKHLQSRYVVTGQADGEPLPVLWIFDFAGRRTRLSRPLSAFAVFERNPALLLG